jgi:serine/threonine protein kinase
MNSIEASQEEAAVRAQILWNRDSNIGLTQEQLLGACRSIDELLTQMPNTKAFVQCLPQFGCEIEWISCLKGTIIRGLSKTTMRIGRGVHKSVRKALLYAPSPQIVAECLCDETGFEEVSVLKKFKGERGIISFLGVVERPKRRCSMYLEYFPGGSLLGALGNGHRFPERQILSIARDISCGLSAMHKRHFVHRDLHPGNILLRFRSSDEVEAVLIDFGKAIDVRQCTGTETPQAPRGKNPPEALLKSFRAMDRYAVDIYALGCNFYHMIWGKEPSWHGIFDVYAVGTYSDQTRAQFHRRIREQYSSTKEKKISSILDSRKQGTVLTPFERLKVLTFRMLDPNPSRRPSASKVMEELLTGEDSLGLRIFGK